MTPAAPPAADGRSRCSWATGEWLTPYHDTEWGVVVHDDMRHFEQLVLEAAQAGLSWLTVLKRREHYRHLFVGFDAAAVARFGEFEIAAMMQDPGVIRNRLKLEAAVGNARARLHVAAEHGSFDSYLWGFVDGAVVTTHWTSMASVPATSPV